MAVRPHVYLAGPRSSLMMSMPYTVLDVNEIAPSGGGVVVYDEQEYI